MSNADLHTLAVLLLNRVLCDDGIEWCSLADVAELLEAGEVAND
ncbi:MAG TPA: hypothetical protein PKA88_23790 [Polyangiaceae bacterium]|nr:hypothetical protein [Polyangiaceae bacterium]HMR73963.1 hypothetical protein [Polyangiaceae bacterium]